MHNPCCASCSARCGTGSLPVGLVLTTVAAAATGTLLAGVAGLVPAAWLRRAPASALLAED